MNHPSGIWDPFKLPRNYEEGLTWGLWWSGRLSSPGFPFVVLVFILASRHGVRHALDVLGVLLIVMVASRIFFTLRSLQAIHVHTKVCPAMNLKPCTAPCSCGCGHTFETVPKSDCGRPCPCGCGRPCVVHEGHRGECGS